MKRRQRLDPIHFHPAFSTVERVLVALNQAGHQAVLAGGAVRDALLERPIKDFDVATSARPDEVEKLFRSTIDVGRAFGTMVVVENGYNFEVTMFRSETDYQDGRRPNSVAASSMEEDAQRRDFTVNAFFYDPFEFLLYDFVGGLEDLEAKCLRTVGVAEERFQEDHLRMLRAVRFISQLGFDLDRDAQAAIARLADRLSKISAERILNEFQRLLVGPFLGPALKVLRETGLYRSCFPEIESLPHEKLKAFLSFMSWENAMAALFILIDQEPETRLRAWKASRESLKRVEGQMAGARKLMDPKSSRADRIMALGGAHFAETLVLVAGLLQLKGEKRRLDGWIREYLDVASPTGELPKAFLTGEDLKNLGVPASPQFGDLLKTIYREQLEGRVRNREEALRRARELTTSSV